jgi:hypothetical protein
MGASGKSVLVQWCRHRRRHLSSSLHTADAQVTPAKAAPLIRNWFRHSGPDLKGSVAKRPVPKAFYARSDHSGPVCVQAGVTLKATLIESLNPAQAPATVTIPPVI